ncbi:hypothetical protein J2X72_002856 [Phyllobacterium sp. 1468]|uniref:hypothetical protein n=1 Tax=Phyllobacterium sp. 1468 TaxID=2817759 RepID=UPI0028542E51|nr:hypothetical protein [Phyllobacterium sp. 1468]MDR6634056.1 hypothetical protein [Phyllobacterium sp. 1468]
MTTISQVSQTLKPVLARNPDVVLMGRFLFLKPVRHMLKGIYIDRSSDKNEFVTIAEVNLILLDQGRWKNARCERLYGFYVEPGELSKLENFPMIGKSIPHPDSSVGKMRVTWDMRRAILDHNQNHEKPKHRDDEVRIEVVCWDITRPASIELMYEMIEEDVLPNLRKIVSFDDFETFAAAIGPADEFPYKTSTFERMLMATAAGHFDKAQELWNSIEQKPVYPAGRLLEILIAENPTFHLALLAGDRAALAKIFHDWEAQSVRSYGIESFWERTPFPLEL